MHSLTYTPPADDSIPPIGLNLGMYDNLSRTHPFSAEQGQEAVHGRETEAFFNGEVGRERVRGLVAAVVILGLASAVRDALYFLVGVSGVDFTGVCGRT